MPANPPRKPHGDKHLVGSSGAALGFFSTIKGALPKAGNFDFHLLQTGCNLGECDCFFYFLHFKQHRVFNTVKALFTIYLTLFTPSSSRQSS